MKDSTKYAAEIFRGQKSFLFLGEAKALYLAHANGVDSEQWAEFAVPEQIKEIALAKKSYIGRSPFSNFPTKRPDSFLAAPLGGENPKGVICVIAKDEEFTYQGEDGQLLGLLADYISIALTNAGFYQEVREKEDEISNGISN